MSTPDTQKTTDASSTPDGRVGSGPLLGGSGENPPERQKDWQTEIHDSEVFLLFQGQQAGILFPAPGFEMWHINHAVATLNAYFPTSPAKR